MGLRFSSLFRLFFSNREVRVVCVGLDAAGKTTIGGKLARGENLTTIPTIGFNVEQVQYKNLNLQLWDVGGQTRLRSLWRHYYQNTDCMIFVIDSADRQRVAEASDELHAALSDDNLRNASLLVYANKQDLPNAMSTGELTEHLKLRDLRNRRWFIQGCSAVTGNGLYEGLDWLAGNLPPARSG